MYVSRSPRETAAAPAEWITGEARIERLAAPEDPSRTQVDSVHFAPGSRTHWHTHPLGQVLVVTRGTGLVQRRGGPVETIRAGDTVRIDADEWHWHGAAGHCAMTHLAIEELPQDGSTGRVGAAVTDSEFAAGRGEAVKGEGEGEAGDGVGTGVGAGAGVSADPVPPVSREVVMDQRLPRPLATGRVEVRRITIAPGFAAGLHIHNGPVFGSIETGSALYQIEGRPETVLEPGAVFYEPEGVRIARFDAREEGVTFLGYFLLPEGVDAELVFPEG